MFETYKQPQVKHAENIGIQSTHGTTYNSKVDAEKDYLCAQMLYNEYKNATFCRHRKCTQIFSHGSVSVYNRNNTIVLNVS